VANDVLIVGYGNPLRGDDGIGQTVAMALRDDASRRGAQVIVCQQLTPELAECFAAVDLVVLLDAAANTKPGTIAVRAIRAATGRSSGLVHSADPAALLDLTRRLYGRSPEAFLVTIGASSLELGEGLSEVAVAALPEAVATVRRLLLEHRSES
jgi:hydrogenase maturation protease